MRFLQRINIKSYFCYKFKSEENFDKHFSFQFSIQWRSTLIKVCNIVAQKKKEFYRYVNVVVQFSVNFILGLKFIFLCLAYGNEFKTNCEIQIKPRIKLSHNINISESNFLKYTFTPFGPRYLQLRVTTWCYGARIYANQYMPMSMSYNESIMESWFHRPRGVSGFIVSCVSWFHRFSGVNRFMVSQVSWCQRFGGFMGFVVSKVWWFDRFHSFMDFMVSKVSWFHGVHGVRGFMVSQASWCQVASPPTSFGVCSSRVHFSPTDVC